jgi:flavin reductase (DIM6/NTAB) family NADH-FMN oxidoreductase RutF
MIAPSDSSRRLPADPAGDAPTNRPAVDPDAFRSVLGRFATGVTVITSVDAGGRDHGMTVSAFCSLSLDPPLVLACIDHTATMHDLLADGTPLVINILSAGQEALSRRFAAGDPPNRFDGVGYTRGALGPAILDDVLAWLECRVVARHPGGDHTIVVGHVEAVGTRQERPLLYYRSGYATLER